MAESIESISLSMFLNRKRFCTSMTACATALKRFGLRIGMLGAALVSDSSHLLLLLVSGVCVRVRDLDRVRERRTGEGDEAEFWRLGRLAERGPRDFERLLIL